MNGLASIMGPERAKKPTFKMILTATGPYANERPKDGIVACAISALKP